MGWKGITPLSRWLFSEFYFYLVAYKEEERTYTITAELYEPGIDMWLGSQEKWITVLKSK